MTVNSYLAWDTASGAAVAFDTGADCSGMLALLAEKKLTLKLILLTHTHGDHIFDLDRLKEKTGAPAFVGDREPIDGAETFSAGRTFEAGALKIASATHLGSLEGRDHLRRQRPRAAGRGRRRRRLCRLDGRRRR